MIEVTEHQVSITSPVTVTRVVARAGCSPAATSPRTRTAAHSRRSARLRIGISSRFYSAAVRSAGTSIPAWRTIRP